jgi:CheY-like chemotaxis protein/anti-sigma regulatory factor (Ser/Thr protein kinase)
VDVQADPVVNPQDKIRVLLFQAVRELLFNVVKHAGTDQVHVRMHEQQGQVQIVVEDEGVGFDLAEALARHESSPGFGLFSIGQRLEWLGGAMHIDSSPGRGTRIELLAPQKLPEGEKRDLVQEAPLAEVLQQAGAVSAGKHPPKDPEPIRVVLADDHAVLRDGLAQLLQTESDIEVVGQAGDGLQAVDMALQLHPDVVLMDVSMPGLNGIEATRRIKDRSPETRVIGLSMHVRAGMADAMRQAGASGYLTKSVGPEDLVRTIREAT